MARRSARIAQKLGTTTTTSSTKDVLPLPAPKIPQAHKAPKAPKASQFQLTIALTFKPPKPKRTITLTFARPAPIPLAPLRRSARIQGTRTRVAKGAAKKIALRKVKFYFLSKSPQDIWNERWKGIATSEAAQTPASK